MPSIGPAKPTDARAAQMRRQRRLVSGYFACAGIVTAVWGARLPSVQARLHLGPGGLSVGLLCAAAGMVAGLQAGGLLADRIGATQFVRAAAVALAGALALVGVPGTRGPFLLACGIFGAFHGLLDVGMNVFAADCQRAYGRPILQSIHACYSMGALTGALAAALTARASITAQTTFALTAIALGAVIVTAPNLSTPPSADHPRAPANEEPTPAAPQTPHSARIVIALGVLALCSLLGEGAASDWAAVHLHTVLHASTAVSASAYGCYSAAMALARLRGDHLIRRFGPVRVVRTGSLIAAVGLGLGLVIPHAAAALTGWTLLGAGLAGVVPATITAAANARPHRAGRDIALVSATGYLGMVAGPAAIGALAAATNLTIALALPAALALCAALAAGAVRPNPPSGVSSMTTAPTWALADYNGVIGLQPTRSDWTALAHAAEWNGTLDAFQDRFWNAREDYDLGVIEPEEFWARMTCPTDARAEAIELDTRMWLNTDPKILALLAVARARGARLALLSNAPAPIARRIEQAPWAHLFEIMRFSCDLHSNKPDSPAYELTLTAMDVPGPQRSFVTFIDDRGPNVAAAEALGLTAHHYRGEPAALAGALRVPQPLVSRLANLLTPPTHAERLD